MSDHCAGEGATHYACPCVLRRVARMEAALKLLARGGIAVVMDIVPTVIGRRWRVDDWQAHVWDGNERMRLWAERALGETDG